MYASGIKTGKAVESAFEAAASETRRLQEAAMIMRHLVQTAMLESAPMPWPPSANFLLSDTITPPQILQEFIAYVLTGKKLKDASSRKARLVKSIAQDISVAASNGKWLMPKHLVLDMILRHLTGRADIITLVNRWGNCACYDTML